jgi:hypothetical protein
MKNIINLKKYILNSFPLENYFLKNETNNQSFFFSIITCIICNQTFSTSKNIKGFKSVCPDCKNILKEYKFMINLKNEDLLNTQILKNNLCLEIEWATNWGIKYLQLYDSQITKNIWNDSLKFKL